MKQKNGKEKLIIALCIIGGFLLIYGPIAFIITLSIFDNQTTFKVLDNGDVSINKNKAIIENNVRGYYDSEAKCYYVIGTLKNNSKKSIGANVTYNLYRGNTVIGVADAYISKLNKGENWEFKANNCDVLNEVTNFKIVEASVYNY